MPLHLHAAAGSGTARRGPRSFVVGSTSHIKDAASRWSWSDVIIPLGALLVICFALASAFSDPALHLPGSKTQETLGAYKASSAGGN